MNINQAFPSKYLRADDLGGQAHVMTIARCVMEDVGGEGRQEHKPVLYFQGTEKGVVLNKTNAGTVAYLHGPETDGWVGKQIEVFPDTVLFNNQMVPCIRLRQHMAPATPGGLGGQAQAPLPQGQGALAQPLQTAAGPQHDERNPPDPDPSDIPF